MVLGALALLLLLVREQLPLETISANSERLVGVALITQLIGRDPLGSACGLDMTGKVAAAVGRRLDPIGAHVGRRGRQRRGRAMQDR